MKKSLLSASLVFSFLFSANAQVVQWASKVIEFSSELTPIQYSAQQALGKPNVLPAGGQNPNAWAPDKPNRKEFLKLGFTTPMSIRQVAIAESHGPGAIYKVMVYDEAGTEHELNTLNPRAVPLKGRMLNLFTDKTTYKVSAVRIEFDGAAIPEYFQIDAVAIADSNYPIIADIPKPQLLNSGILIEPLSKNVNSEFTELNPLLSPDGKTLYFSRTNHPDNVGGIKDKEDIWYSELDSTGHWELARNLSQFNTAGPNFVSTISSVTPDGKAAIIVLGNKNLENGKQTAGVSISNNVNGEWTKPIALNIKNEYNLNEKANFFLANDKKTLLMSVERGNSQGGRDIYVSFMESDSVWTEPLSLGDIINTAGEETAPFLATDGRTIYFSSNGFSGYGGSDVYVSKRLDETWTTWSDPENMGPEINSPLEDLFFNIPSVSEYAYYSRGVSESNLDIFRIKMPIFKKPDVWVTVKGKVIDAATGEPMAAKLVYERLSDGKQLGTTTSSAETGDYEFKLLAGTIYGIRVDMSDKIAESQNIDLSNLTEAQTINPKDFLLEAIKVASIKENAMITLNNIFFDFDKAVLKKESFPELDRMIKVLTEKPTITIEVTGHTDAVGTEAYNKELSKRRAQAVSKYFATNGVSKDRIAVSFFGESKPLESNATPGGRKKNRRVEFKIIKV